VGVALELVDAPDESRAVVAAARRDAEVDLRPVARASPDVRHPDLREGDIEDLALPVVDHRQGERAGEALHLADLPAVSAKAEAEDLRRRVRRLGAGRRILRPELEEVLRRGVVQPQAEQAGDDLEAKAPGNDEAVGARTLRELLGRLPEADRLHEAAVE